MNENEDVIVKFEHLELKDSNNKTQVKFELPLVKIDVFNLLFWFVKIGHRAMLEQFVALWP
jgi:hypothetical protein